MAEAALYPRYVEPRLREALADTPVVLIQRTAAVGQDDAGARAE
jgi:hypothetical protein